MRILHVTSHLNVGGVTSAVMSLAEGCARRGHHVAIAADDGQRASELPAMGVEHWRVPLHTSAELSLSVWRAARQLGPLAKRHGVDVAHAHTRVAQVVAERLWRQQGIPYVATWHGFFRRRLGRRLWPCTGLLTIAISEPVARHLRDEFRVPADRVRVIPHGIDVARFAAPVSTDEQQSLRQRYGLDGGPIIGTMARLVAAKSVDALIESFALLVRRAPSAKLLIIGDGEDRSRLEQLAASRGLASHVRFTGTLPDARAALSLMNVFVFLPADREGFGLSLLEAMAAGRPIVAIKRGGGSTWLLEETGAAVVVEPGNNEQLSEAILAIATDRDRAAALTAKSLATVRERYTLDREVDEHLRVYDECLAMARRAHQ